MEKQQKCKKEGLILEAKTQLIEILGTKKEATEEWN